MYYAQKRELNFQLRNCIKSTAGLFARLMPFKSLVKLSGRDSILPFYHLVSDEELPHINQLYSVRGSALFEKDLDFLLKYYHPITLSELIKSNRGEKIKSSKPFMHLSFDDGLRPCYDVIAPILQRKGVAATFFLNSDFIDNSALMFRYKVSLCLNALNNLKSVEKRKLQEKSMQLFAKKDPALASYNETTQLDELAKLLALDFDAYLREQKPYMNSEEIEKLIKLGFSIGSHSVDHPLYSELKLEEQLNQTLRSQKFIEDKFGIDYRVFAFPFSDYMVKKDFFKAIFEDEKFDLCFGVAGLKIDAIKQNLQRFPMESQKNDSAHNMLSTEYLYYLLRKPFGKHIVKRF